MTIDNPVGPILQSGETGKFVTLTTSCERPAALDAATARKMMA